MLNRSGFFFRIQLFFSHGNKRAHGFVNLSNRRPCSECPDAASTCVTKAVFSIISRAGP